MSRIIATAAIRGAYKCMDRAETMLAEAVNRQGRDQSIGFPGTAYALPVILALTGKRVEKLGELDESFPGVVFPDLLNRPAGVLGDQRLGICSGPVQRGQGGFIPDVAQRNADVSQQAAPFCPQHRSPVESQFECVVIQ